MISNYLREYFKEEHPDCIVINKKIPSSYFEEKILGERRVKNENN